MSNEEQLGAYAFVEGKYPSKRIIYQFLVRCLEEFNNLYGDKWQSEPDDKDLLVKAIDELFIKYQDPKNVSKVHEAQYEVDNLKETIYDNIKMLLERQGQIEDLADKSHDLK